MMRLLSFKQKGLKKVDLFGFSMGGIDFTRDCAKTAEFGSKIWLYRELALRVVLESVQLGELLIGIQFVEW